MKNFKIKLNFELNERKVENYANDVTLFSNNVDKVLICDNTKTNEEIFDEVKEHFQNQLKEFSRFLKNRNIVEKPKEDLSSELNEF